MALYVFSIIALYFYVNWIGLLFALKPFDDFGKSCKENWFWHLLGTICNTFMAYLCFIRGEEFMSKTSTTVAMWIWILFFSLMILPTITNAVSNFHNKQKAKRK